MASSKLNARLTPAVLGNVLYPVSDVPRAVDFFERVLAIPRLFVDGNRYAALDGGGVKLAIAGETERLVEVPAASFKVEDVQAALDRTVEAGGDVVSPCEVGPHEVRAVARDPWGNAFIVYGPR